ENACVGRDLPNCGLNIFRERHRVALRARDKMRLLRVSLKTRVIDVVTNLIDQTVVLDVTNEADNFRATGSIVIAVDSFTDWIVVGPHPIRQLFVDDSNIAVIVRLHSISITEQATAK